MNYCPLCATPLVTRAIDHQDYLACSACHFVFWDNPVPVVMALVRIDHKYVLAHNRLWPEGVYSFITGYVDRHETPEQAAVREVKEELNLEGTIQQFLGHYMFRQKNQIIIAYEVNATGSIKSNHELDDIVLVSPEELAVYDFGSYYITAEVVARWAEQLEDTGTA